MSTITGYKYDTEGAYIEKDRLSELVYTMDWVDWLGAGENLAAVTYSITPPAYNPTPVTILSSGYLGTQTYVELAAGTRDKIYTITAAITTDGGAVDRRSFRVKVENRSL
jgi:hypothetical protein